MILMMINNLKIKSKMRKKISLQGKKLLTEVKQKKQEFLLIINNQLDYQILKTKLINYNILVGVLAFKKTFWICSLRGIHNNYNKIHLFVK